MRQTTRTDDHTGGRVRLTDAGLFWLVAAGLAGLIGWWKSINLVLLLAYSMLVLLLINTLLARSQVRSAKVTRDSTRPVFAGEDAAVRLGVANAGRRPITVTVQSRLGDEPADWLVLQLPAGAVAACTARRVFPVRGVFPVPPVRVASGFPLGLLDCERLWGGSGELVVLPAVGVIDPSGLRRWVLLQGGGGGRTRQVLRRVTTDQADVRGVRPYRPGDPIRSIHWRSSARRGELMVREYDAPPSPELVLVVEPWLPPHPTAVHRGNLEAALSLTATLARNWVEVYGTRVTVAVAGDPFSVRTATGTDTGIREALAPLAVVTGGPEFDPLPPRALGRGLVRATRLVVSSRSGSPYGGALTRATGRSFGTLAPADHPRWYQPPGPWSVGSRQRAARG